MIITITLSIEWETNGSYVPLAQPCVYRQLQWSVKKRNTWWHVVCTNQVRKFRMFSNLETERDWQRWRAWYIVKLSVVVKQEVSAIIELTMRLPVTRAWVLKMCDVKLRVIAVGVTSCVVRIELRVLLIKRYCRYKSFGWSIFCYFTPMHVPLYPGGLYYTLVDCIIVDTYQVLVVMRCWIYTPWSDHPHVQVVEQFHMCLSAHAIFPLCYSPMYKNTHTQHS